MLQEDYLHQAISRATQKVFETMLGVSVVAEAPTSETDFHTNSKKVVTNIGLSGAWVGSGSLTCGAPVACQIASRFLMADYSAVDGDVLDAMAELTNMIIGNVKNDVEVELGPMGLSTPTVIFGEHFSTRSSLGSWTVVPFRLNDSELPEHDQTVDVKICLAPYSAKN